MEFACHSTHRTKFQSLTCQSSLTSPNAPYEVILVTMQKQQAIAISPTVGKYAENAAVAYLGNNGTGVADYREFIPPSQIVLAS